MSFRKLYNSVKSAFHSFTEFTPLEKQNVILEDSSTANVSDVLITTNEHVDDASESSDEESVFEIPFFERNISTPSSSDYDLYSFIDKSNNNYHDFMYMHEYPLTQTYDKPSGITIRICLYNMNSLYNVDGEPVPFLKYLMVKIDEKSYGLPKFVFNYPQFMTDDEVQKYFRDECLKTLLRFFVIEGYLQHNVVENMDKSYGGFLDIDYENVLVFFDAGIFLPTPFRASTLYPTWVIVDEILQSRKTIEIDTITRELFKNKPVIHEIRNRNGTEVPLPISLCLFDIERGELFKKPATPVILEPRSHHAIYGNFYYFMDDVSIQFPSNYRRCAVLIDNEIIIHGSQHVPQDVEMQSVSEVDTLDDSLLLTEDDSEITESTSEVFDNLSTTSSDEYLGEPTEQTSPDEYLGEPIPESSPDEDLGEPISESSPIKDLGKPISETSPNEDLGEPTTESSPNEYLGEPTEQTSPNEDLGESTEQTSPDEYLGEPTEQTSPDEYLGEPTTESSPDEDLGEPTEQTSPDEDLGEPTEQTSPDEDLGGLPFTSVILFEHNGAKTWCIKTESLFVEL